MKLRPDGRYQATKQVKGIRTFGYGKTPQEAEADLAQKLGGNLTLMTLSGAVTLYDLAKEVWWPHLETLAPLSKKRYLATYGKFINSTLGRVPVKDINSLVLTSWLNHLDSSGVPAGSRRYALQVLSAILSHAFRLELIQSNPCTRVRVPVRKTKRDKILPVEEALGLLEKTKETELAAPIYLAMVFGLRRGEIAGLKWSDLDRKRGELRIVRQRQEIRPLGVIERELKTDSSKRTLFVPQALIDEIDSRGDLASEYICTHRGQPWVPNTIGELWGKYRERWGLKDWHFHDLRHLAAGLLHAAGCDLLMIAAILGHKKPDMALIYTSIEVARRRKGAELLVGLFSKYKVRDSQ